MVTPRSSTVVTSMGFPSGGSRGTTCTATASPAPSVPSPTNVSLKCVGALNVNATPSAATLSDTLVPGAALSTVGALPSAPPAPAAREEGMKWGAPFARGAGLPEKDARVPKHSAPARLGSMPASKS